MSEALAEVEWIRGLFEELTNPKFSIVEWAARSRNRGLFIAARSSDAEARFPKVLSIGDAKSLYDHLRTETSGGANDRRTAIDIQIIRASMDAQGAMVRWVDHSGMYADAMTNSKKQGSDKVVSLRKTLHTQTFAAGSGCWHDRCFETSDMVPSQGSSTCQFSGITGLLAPLNSPSSLPLPHQTVNQYGVLQQTL